MCSLWRQSAMCSGAHGPRMENVNSNGRFGWKNTCLEKLCHRVDFEFHRQSKDQTGELECWHMPRTSGSCFLTSGAQPTGLCHEEYVGGGWSKLRSTVPGGFCSPVAHPLCKNLPNALHKNKVNTQVMEEA